jgi:hypothetical protein
MRLLLTKSTRFHHTIPSMRAIRVTPYKIARTILWYMHPHPLCTHLRISYPHTCTAGVPCAAQVTMRRPQMCVKTLINLVTLKTCAYNPNNSRKLSNYGFYCGFCPQTSRDDSFFCSRMSAMLILATTVPKKTVLSCYIWTQACNPYDPKTASKVCK